MHVSSYGNTTSTIIASGGKMHVYSGAHVTSTIINSGGSLHVSSGGSAYQVSVYKGGNMSVFNRGSALFVHLSGGYAHVSSGGTIDGAFVRNGSIFVYEGGEAINPSVSNGGVIRVYSGGFTDILQVYSGGKGYISNGGVANDTYISSGGTMTVHSGATVNYTYINAKGLVEISGGTVTSAQIINSGYIHVSRGGEVSSAIVSGGTIYVRAGGTAVAPIVSSGGVLVSNGGTVSKAQISGGAMYISNGGVASSAEVWSGGVLHVLGSAGGAVVRNSGRVYVYSGGVANAATVSSGGTMTIQSGATGNATTVGRYGNLVVYNGGKLTGSFNIIRDAKVSVSAGGIVDVDISTVAPGTAARVAGLSFISGSPTLTITVSAAQAKGDYKLASGVGSAFDRNFTVVTDKGTTLGTVSVGGTLNSGGTYYTLKLASNALSLTVSENAPPPAASTPGDLNADGRADIVMTITQTTHPDCGATGAWLIRADQTAEWGDLSTRNEGWEIFGTGVTTAGKSTNDVYIKSTGNVVGAWVTDNSGKVAGWATVGEFDASTEILGLGDFNGDGKTDLLLRNTNGAVGCHLTDGTGWNYFGSLGNEWTVCAVGDLNGDGRDDVVLKHDAGFAGSWLTQADCTMAWADLDTLPDGFSIVGCGDFNGDGTSDVLLKNGNYYGAWIVQNGNAKSWMGLGDLGSVTVEQIADFDADGKDDLRIRTTGGDLGAQLVKGADTLTWKYYGSVGNEWSTSLAAI